MARKFWTDERRAELQALRSHKTELQLCQHFRRNLSEIQHMLDFLAMHDKKIDSTSYENGVKITKYKSCFPDGYKKSELLGSKKTDVEFLC